MQYISEHVDPSFSSTVSDCEKFKCLVLSNLKLCIEVINEKGTRSKITKIPISEGNSKIKKVLKQIAKSTA